MNFKQIYRHLRRFSALLCTAFLFTGTISGCAARTDMDQPKADHMTDRPKMFLYCLSQDLSAVVTLPYEGDAQAVPGQKEAAVEDMLLQLTAPGASGIGCATPISGFSVRGWELHDGELLIDVSDEYSLLPAVQAVMSRAAIVCSLCQIDGVDSVSFCCGSKLLTDSDGISLEKMTPSMFVINTGNEIANYTRVRLHLYFANEEGNRLLDTFRTVVYNANVSMERLVVEQVLKGPNSDLVRPTLNPAAKVLSVTVRDGVCYVNLDRTFLSEPYNVTPQVAVYSLVNSLTELDSVQKVQISVDGETDTSFMETMKLRTLYERNHSIIQNYNEER